MSNFNVAHFNDLRRIALSFPEVEEGIAYGSPIFKIKGKMIARLREDGKSIVVKVDKMMRSSLLDGAPDIYFIEDHYLDHPLILIHLDKISIDDLRSLVEMA
ncbi:MAG: MmcQ/YjbR family DNA-binding protein [Chloracidobacterium sp.]|nr:MmcQ/YjbR family DNA-binding protein [Chloracidobacterium sp.]